MTGPPKGVTLSCKQEKSAKCHLGDHASVTDQYYAWSNVQAHSPQGSNTTHGTNNTHDQGNIS